MTGLIVQGASRLKTITRGNSRSDCDVIPLGSDSHNIVLTLYRKKLPRGVIIYHYYMGYWITISVYDTSYTDINNVPFLYYRVSKTEDTKFGKMFSRSLTKTCLFPSARKFKSFGHQYNVAQKVVRTEPDIVGADLQYINVDSQQSKVLHHGAKMASIQRCTLGEKTTCDERLHQLEETSHILKRFEENIGLQFKNNLVEERDFAIGNENKIINSPFANAGMELASFSEQTFSSERRTLDHHIYQCNNNSLLEVTDAKPTLTEVNSDSLTIQQYSDAGTDVDLSVAPDSEDLYTKLTAPDSQDLYTKLPESSTSLLPYVDSSETMMKLTQLGKNFILLCSSDIINLRLFLRYCKTLIIREDFIFA